jgi:transcriptional regulator with XRE-family HTH domain
MESVTDRLRQVMESQGYNAKGFAELLGIQRSGLSHIFSGRNKPGLDLIQKILEVFPEVSADWLLMGKGNHKFTIVTDATAPVTRPLADSVNITPNEVTYVNRQKGEVDVYSDKHASVSISDVISVDEALPVSHFKEQVNRLILLNENGTFTLYTKA